MPNWKDNPAIRNLPYPETGGRVETGVVRFGDDWPALHFRGDSAFGEAMHLQRIAAAYEATGKITGSDIRFIRSLAEFFLSCNISELNKESNDGQTQSRNPNLC